MSERRPLEVLAVRNTIANDGDPVSVQSAGGFRTTKPGAQTRAKRAPLPTLEAADGNKKMRPLTDSVAPHSGAQSRSLQVPSAFECLDLHSLPARPRRYFATTSHVDIILPNLLFVGTRAGLSCLGDGSLLASLAAEATRSRAPAPAAIDTTGSLLASLAREASRPAAVDADACATPEQPASAFPPEFLESIRYVCRRSYGQVSNIPA